MTLYDNKKKTSAALTMSTIYAGLIVEYSSNPA